jgi:hypothetical protein
MAALGEGFILTEIDCSVREESKGTLVVLTVAAESERLANRFYQSTHLAVSLSIALLKHRRSQTS